MNKADWERAVQFHGHSCPGLAIGFKAVQAAQEQLGITFAADEEIVCVTENDACGVDAIQVLTGCSMGKGNLIFRDRGKMAYTFFLRDQEKGLRMIVKPLAAPMERQQHMEYVLQAKADEIFDFMAPDYDLPATARIFTSVECELCGEKAAEHKMRLQEGRKVCLDCFKEYERGW